MAEGTQGTDPELVGWQQLGADLGGKRAPSHMTLTPEGDRPGLTEPHSRSLLTCGVSRGLQSQGAPRAPS